MRKILILNATNSLVGELDKLNLNELKLDIVSLSPNRIETVNKNIKVLSGEEIVYYNNSIDYVDQYFTFVNSLYKDFLYQMIRSSTDLQKINYEFYNAVNFWFHYFSENSLVFVINLTQFHGRPSDIASKVAEFKNIDSYEMVTVGNKYFAIINRLGLVFSENKSTLSSQINFNIPYNILTAYEYTNLTRKKGVFNDLFIRNLIAIFGIQNLRMIYHFIQSHVLSNLTNKEKYLRLKVSNIYYRNVLKYYKKIITTPKKDEKYVYFSLNLEPEANINGKTIINSQLYYIEQISLLLPANIKMYVKDHPHYYNMNFNERFYLFENSQFYRSESFYRKIDSLKNVRLIDHKIKSFDLIKNSLLNICMTGSIIYESIELKRPILILEPGYSFGKMLDRTIYFQNRTDTFEFISKMDRYYYSYKNVGNFEEMVSKYLFDKIDFTDPDKLLTIFRNLLDK